ncbi:glycosyltransferase family 2 protein [Hyaloraphidium curvatum]|nr:glycosyltransferase family 2 protein [Hyaloraphidium curvatum]
MGAAAAAAAVGSRPAGILEPVPLSNDAAPPRGASKTTATVPQPVAEPPRRPWNWWRVTVLVLTFWAVRPLLSCCGIKTRDQQDAWREKVALCIIILLLCTLVGFLTFGFTQTVCGKPAPRIQGSQLAAAGATAIYGRGISTDGYTHPPTEYGLIDLWTWTVGRDIGFLFPPPPEQSVCRRVLGSNYTHWPCTIPGVWPRQQGCVVRSRRTAACHYSAEARDVAFRQLRFQGDVFFDWEQIIATAPPATSGQVTVSDPLYIVYNGMVLNIFRMLAEAPDFLGPAVRRNVILNLGRDATLAFTSSNDLRQRAECLVEIFKVGVVDPKSVGCVVSDVVLYVSLVFIVAVVLIKFILAVAYHWILSRKLGDASAKKKPNTRRGLHLQHRTATPTAPAPMVRADESQATLNSTTGQNLKVEVLAADSVSLSESNLAGRSENSVESEASAGTQTPMVPAVLGYGNGMEKPVPEKWRSDLAYTILMVTCYSEGEEGIRSTLDSLAMTDYPDERKLLLVVCDGIVKGAGNDKSTPDIVTGMVAPAPEALAPLRFPDPPPALSYVAIADGSRRLNCARVHAGYYRHALEGYNRRVPMVVIVKVGNAEEQKLAAEGKLLKPGNRGKRDSQIVVMNFLSKVIFDDRLTDFEYDLFSKIWSLGGMPPDQYEAIMFVDADTKVYPDSLRHLVATFMRDPNIMGLCGETKIENKTESWVTMIQVFEYHISHHLNKAFESVFGGVTCLPGCFCMYRIKAPKGPEGYYVPILANPDIVEKYAENVVDTLHKKNLLLLGEDRYLTTLMLKTFPRRKLLFVPQAKCKTTVPDRFKILLSQRRRWINSTVHNLFELVLVRDLCGTFCISMQFVVFMELVGTLVLPAAICFTIYLLIISFFTTPPPIIPLVLLLTILGLPGVLIVFTAQSVTYVFWMFIYILSLPIWNFVLPIYSYWHFDDFSWGQTRMVSGESGKTDHAKDGDFDGSGMYMRRWVEWEAHEREKLSAALMSDMNTMAIMAGQKGVAVRPFDQDHYVTAAIEQAEAQMAARDKARRAKQAKPADEKLKGATYSNSRAPPRESWLLNAGSSVSLASQPEMAPSPTSKPLR